MLDSSPSSGFQGKMIKISHLHAAAATAGRQSGYQSLMLEHELLKHVDLDLCLMRMDAWAGQHASIIADLDSWSTRSWARWAAVFACACMRPHMPGGHCQEVCSGKQKHGLGARAFQGAWMGE